MSSAPPEAGQWQRIAPYLDQALDLQAEERERWLRELTATEPEIAQGRSSMPWQPSREYTTATRNSIAAPVPTGKR